MASLPSSSKHDIDVARDSTEQIQEAARRAVQMSPLMDEILRAIEAKGLEPIWGRLIEEFGTMMYSQGRLSRPTRGGAFIAPIVPGSVRVMLSVATERQAGAQPSALARRRFDDEPTAVTLDTVTHPDEAVRAACRLGGVEADTVVVDRHDRAVATGGEREVDEPCVRILADVRQRFLDQPENREPALRTSTTRVATRNRCGCPRSTRSRTPAFRAPARGQGDRARTVEGLRRSGDSMR